VIERGQEKIQSEQNWESIICQNLSLKQPLDDIKQRGQVANASFCIVTDGGTYEYNGTYGVIITHEETMIATNYGKLYSPEFYESSYRSEIYALLAGIVSFRYVISGENQIVERAVNIYCDNKSLIKRINNRRRSRMTVNQHRDAEVDVELQVLCEIEQLEIQNTKVKISYVKSHKQTTKDQFVSAMEHVHNYADNLCKQARLLPDQNEYHSFPANKVELVLNERVITAHAPKATAKAYHSINMNDYYREKYHWTGTIIRSIWWKAYGKSLTKLNQPEKMKVQKFINDWMPTNKRLHKYCKDHSCICSSCGSEVEDEDHFIRCHTYGRQKIRTEWLSALKEYLSSSHTPVSVKTSILTNMTRWFEPTTAPCGSYQSNINCEATKRAEYLQSRIGWHNSSEDE
jgi:ribonuclease HI